MTIQLFDENARYKKMSLNHKLDLHKQTNKYIIFGFDVKTYILQLCYIFIRFPDY